MNERLNFIEDEFYSDPTLRIQGTIIIFKCPSEMLLIGPNATTCMGNGEWEPDPRETTCKGTLFDRLVQDHLWAITR